MFQYAKAAMLPFIAFAGIQLARAEPPPAAQAQRPDPSEAGFVVPAVVYQSAFSDYKRLGADKAIPWKAANDEVANIGGWRAYAKEARGAAAPANSAVQAPAGASTDHTATVPAAAAEGKAVAAPAAAASAGKTGPPAAQEPAKPTPGGHAGHQMK